MHVFPSNTFQLEQITERAPTLLPSQYAMYKFTTLEPNGELTEWAKIFLDTPPEEISLRVFMDNSTEDAVLVDFQLGTELHQHIAKYLKESFTKVSAKKRAKSSAK